MLLVASISEARSPDQSRDTDELATVNTSLSYEHRLQIRYHIAAVHSVLNNCLHAEIQSFRAPRKVYGITREGMSFVLLRVSFPETLTSYEGATCDVCVHACSFLLNTTYHVRAPRLIQGSEVISLLGQ